MWPGGLSALGAPVSVEDLATSMYDEVSADLSVARSENRSLRERLKTALGERDEKQTSCVMLRAMVAERDRNLAAALKDRDEANIRSSFRQAELAERDARIEVLQTRLMGRMTSCPCCADNYADCHTCIADRAALTPPTKEET